MASSWAESALSWWHEAGVDTLVGESPRDWLNPKAAPAAPVAAPPPAETMPDALDAFSAWFTALPLDAPAAARLAPEGDPASELMILIDMPGPQDIAAGRLLAGEAGALFERMLAAIGLGRGSVYLAPISPLRTPTGTLDPRRAELLGAAARHHIGLVAPKAVLLFGDACAKLLTGSSVAAARGRWHELATPTGKAKALVTIRPEKLLTQPGLKSHAWADLKLLMEELKP
jgi:uracil-DNA glycosylase